MRELTPATGVVRVAERAVEAKLLLVGDRETLDSVLAPDLSLPIGANATTTSPAGTCLWLGPSLWLLLATARFARHVCLALERDPTDRLAAALDAGGRFVNVMIGGAAASELLAEGCSLDLRERSFAPRRCAQTRIERVPVILYRAAATEFEVIVERPLAQHLWQWLRQAARDL